MLENYYNGNLTWLPNATILFCRHGSHAYDLNTSESDEDFKGICIPPKKYFLGFLNNFEQAESKAPDIVVYNIKKFFKLAVDCNPNIIEILWTDPDEILFVNTLGAILQSKRDLFLSKKAKYTFSGYAIAQLKRIKTHKKWLLNPVERKPLRSDYALPETSVLSQDIMGAIASLESKGQLKDSIYLDTGAFSVDDISSLVMTTYQKERAYFNALREYQQYQNWKTTRNQKRAELERQFGYDTKHAMHLVRLMRMCKEILTLGEVIVRRPDRDELLAIRNGAWSYEKLVSWAEQADLENEKLMQQSKLPDKPNRELLDRLCVDLVSMKNE